MYNGCACETLVIGKVKDVVKRAGCILLASVLFVCGCSENKDKKIVGSWQEVGDPLGRLEFRNDHTGRAFWPNEQRRQESEAMKWVLVNDGTMVSVMTPPGAVNFTIKDDRLVSPNGVVLVKVK